MVAFPHNRLVKAGRYLSFLKNDPLNQVPILRYDKKRKGLTFVIVFQLADSVQILNRSEKGYSSRLERVRFFDEKSLQAGLNRIPNVARESAQVLQVPGKGKGDRDWIRYYRPQELMFLAGGQEVSEDVYNPFRDARTWDGGEFGQADFEYRDYEGIQDFRPFWPQGESQPLVCRFSDVGADLLLMGWYYHGPQLKVSWRPDRKGARWRSSLVAVDRKTGRTFFQGNLFQVERASVPIFFDKLEIKNHKGSELDVLYQEIEKQIRAATLKERG